MIQRFLRASVVAAIALPVLFSSVSADQGANFQELYDKGRQARQAGDFTAAIDAFRAALKIKPRHVETLYLLGTSHAFSGDYGTAREILDRAQGFAPDDVDIMLARARAAAWSGDYATAEAHVSNALRIDPDNAEPRIVDGWLHYIQGRNRLAIEAYKKAVALAPNSDSANKGLAAAIRADKVPPAIAVAKPQAPRLWRLDISYLHSTFSRQSRRNWREPSFGIAHTIGGGLTLSGRVDHSQRFGLNDTRLEAGAARRTRGGHSYYFNVGMTPDDDFLAKIRVMGGLSVRAGQFFGGPLLLSADGRREFYADGVTDTLNPGITQYFGSGHSATAQWINSWDAANSRTFGWLVKGNIRVSDQISVYLGRADAPERVEQATVGQQSWFGGLALTVSPALSLRFDGAREDRQNSYVRRVFGLGATVRY